LGDRKIGAQKLMLERVKTARAVFFALLAGAVLPMLTVAAIELSSTKALAQSSGLIRDIRVEGNRRVEPETVRSYLKFAPGSSYSAEAVDDSLKALFATGLFSDVRIRKQKSTVIVLVVENPIINRVAFEGNSEIDDKTLNSEVQLKPRSVYTRARVQSDVTRILDVYNRQGRFAARVEPKIIKLEQNRVDLVYELHEGPSTKVRAINFIGNVAFSDSQLEDIITTTETNIFSYFKPTNVYDPDRLNLDRELLRQFYLKNGYADARIISAVADLDREGKGFYITFTLEEGELYKFGTINIESALTSVDPIGLKVELLTVEGKVYNASEIDRSIEKLTLKVAENGFAFARVRPRADRDPVGRIIGLTYVIERGPRVYIERINIIGNLRTQDYVIRREFRIAEGDAYNRLLVSRARKRLVGLGFFKKVSIKREPGSAPDRVILNVILLEQSTGELSFGAGFSTQEGVIGDISISERNLLGRGQFLRLKLSGSLERLQIDLSFTEPYFLDRNLAAGFDIFHKEQDFTDEASFKSRKTGGSLRLGFPVSERVRVTTNYSFVRDEVFDVEADASLAVKQSEGTSNVSSVGVRLTYDTRNHSRNPTRGVYVMAVQDLAGLGGDVQYYRTTLEGRAYYPITKKIILVGRAVGGYIEGWGGQEVRLLDLFYKGGETVRGFDRAGFGPRDADTLDALGGRIYYAGTVEVRFPLPFLSEELGLSGAFFADAGSLIDTDSTGLATVLATETIRSSVGASVLWASPVGPLRADFAYVLTSESFDEEELFRFGAATRF